MDADIEVLSLQSKPELTQGFKSQTKPRQVDSTCLLHSNLLTINYNKTDKNTDKFTDKIQQEKIFD